MITQTLPKVLENKAKIRFQHCDPYNHLNNGNYIDYFINHREDVLVDFYDLDIYKIARETGKGWVSSSNQVAYLKPAMLMETVIIQSQLIHYTDTELLAEMRMYNEAKTRLKAVLWAGFVHIDIQKQKRDNHTKEHMNLFKEIVEPIDTDIFQNRINYLRKISV